MAEFEKINDQELENAAGGQYGAANIKHVANLQSGYLAVRTAPEAKYENEIQSTKLYNGDTVQITVVRYNSVNPMQQNNNNSNYYSNPYGYFMNPFGGNYGYSSPYGYEEPATSSGSTELVVGGGYEFITVDVTLELPAESEASVNNG